MAQISKRPVKRVKIKEFKILREKAGEPFEATVEVKAQIINPITEIKQTFIHTKDGLKPEEETMTPTEDQEPIKAQETEGQTDVAENSPETEEPKKPKKGKKNNKKQEN